MRKDSWERLNQLLQGHVWRRNDNSFPKDASPNGIKSICSFMTHMNVMLSSQGKLLDKLKLTKGLLLRFLSVENQVILCSSNRLIMKDLEGIWTNIYDQSSATHPYQKVSLFNVKRLSSNKYRFNNIRSIFCMCYLNIL
ncbi:hypothetical protein NC651_039775 [Populus alba x Populus x berolinensis]|nr:hypothetical protein NC651_039775 [Populus alba x Populus x berolinensis]